ncbi:MAG: META domain-containing protein [Proteobacteria bacterium]|nr:META domain-containing protein [Pseudomonadota bacterium]
MRGAIGFIFFLLFLAGFAFVNLQGVKDRPDSAVTSTGDVAGSAWRATHIGEMRLQEHSEITMQFESDENIVGHSGCNRFMGTYEFSDGILKIGPLRVTRMACPEPDNSLEISFLQALQSASALSRSEARLVVRNEKKDIVARFIATDRNDERE